MDSILFGEHPSKVLEKIYPAQSRRREVWLNIKQLSEEGSTIIMGTNMMDEAEALSKRVAILSRGKLSGIGTPDELKRTLPSGEIIEMRAEIKYDELKMLLQFQSDVRGVAVIKEGEHYELTVNDARRTLPRILETLLKSGIIVHGIDLKRPGLDKVFFHYAGEQLRR
jgi:ABC-2 type transport system ATP-binding protein